MQLPREFPIFERLRHFDGGWIADGGVRLYEEFTPPRLHSLVLKTRGGYACWKLKYIGHKEKSDDSVFLLCTKGNTPIFTCCFYPPQRGSIRSPFPMLNYLKETGKFPDHFLESFQNLLMLIVTLTDGSTV